MALIDELKLRRNAAYNTIEQIEGRISEEEASLKRVRIGMDDLDTAIAALEPAESGLELVPTVTVEMLLADSAEMNKLRITDADRAWAMEAAKSLWPAALEPAPAEPEAEPEPKYQTYRNADDMGYPAPIRDEPAEHISTLTGDPAVEPESGLHGEPAEIDPLLNEWHESFVQDAPADPEPSEIDAEPASVLDNPELLAAVERAEQTLRQDEPAAYVGLNDPELDDAWDAMKRREAADMEAKEKTERSFWGLMGKRKLEEVS